MRRRAPARVLRAPGGRPPPPPAPLGHTPAPGALVIHALGGGSGAMGRWLAPRLSGRQHWVVHDRDADLLELAVAAAPGPAADGAAVTVEARMSNITRLTPDDLAGADLIVASAL